MKRSIVSKTLLTRLPFYLRFLKQEMSAEETMVSSTTIAKALGFGDVQVRKDLGFVSGSGRPKVGYVKEELIKQLEDYLGCENHTKAVIVGAGRLGRALLDYDGFREYGLDILAAFDANPASVGKSIGGKSIMPVDELEAFCAKEHPEIGIMTVPYDSAEAVCDKLVSNGVNAVWNFTGKRLKVPKGVLVRYENLASSLAVLSVFLRLSKEEQTALASEEE